MTVATRKQIATQLGSVPLFSRCTGSDLRIVARHVETLSVEAGRPLCRQVERNGKEVAQLGPGDYFGELSLLDPGPRAASVTVTTPAELAVLGVRMFRVLLRDVPTISSNNSSGVTPRSTKRRNSRTIRPAALSRFAGLTPALTVQAPGPRPAARLEYA